MGPDYATWSARIRQLDRAVVELASASAALGIGLPAGREWLDLLRRKLLPQLDLPPLLVVEIAGGTNIGKSLLFNHLAGETASAVSPLAAGTRHPVCLIPPGLEAPALLERLFEGFTLRAWQSAEDPLAEDPQHLLFWRVGRNMPERLLVLDAPDVDSDVRVNWDRARAIRQAADVLVAVLTQQKYNDAAVKQFFREAVQADKPIVVLFNQVDLEADREFWPQWLETFCTQTGADPELVYVVPHDRQRAGALELPFFEIGRGGRSLAQDRSSLRDDLAALRFDAIKIRTFRGALARVLDPGEGAPQYLESIRRAAAEYAAAEQVLSATEMARIAWPALPPGVLVDEIRDWWDASRQPWSQGVHAFYRRLGQGVTWPLRQLWKLAAPGGVDPLAAFQTREREAIVLAVGKMLDELDRLARVGNDTLRPKLLALLGGTAREELLARVEAAHRELPAVDDDYRAFLRAELEAWKAASPGVVRFLRSLDHAAAIARPAITVLLFVSGWHVAGDLAGQAASHAAGHTLAQIAQEAAIAGGITGGGEALVTSTSEGVRQAAGRLFLRLQARYAQKRAAWLAARLEQDLLGDLLADLRRGAEIPQGQPFTELERILAELGSLARGQGRA